MGGGIMKVLIDIDGRRFFLDEELIKCDLEKKI